jgi:RNA polymerase sigma factor (sigma-70 family)
MLQLMQQKESDNSKDPTRWNPLLLSVAQDRSRAAFQDLFEHFAPLIKAYAFKVTELSKAEILAEELAQETMIKVWIKAHTFDPAKSSAGTWIFTIARNTRIDLIRKYSKQWEANNTEFDENILTADDIWPGQTDDVYTQIETSHNKKKILDLINELPLEQIAVIKIIFLEGLTHSEAASHLNVPLGTVKSRVRLALQKLKLSIDL